MNEVINQPVAGSGIHWNSRRRAVRTWLGLAVGVAAVAGHHGDARKPDNAQISARSRSFGGSMIVPVDRPFIAASITA